MNRVLFLLWVMVLPAWAGPQTSDAALRAAQVPSLPGSSFSGVDDYKGVSIKPDSPCVLNGTPANVGFIDLSGITEVDGAGNITVTPRSGGASGISRVAGQDLTSSSDAFSTIWFNGSNAVVTYSGFSTDPGFPALTIQGGMDRERIGQVPEELLSPWMAMRGRL